MNINQLKNRFLQKYANLINIKNEEKLEIKIIYNKEEYEQKFSKATREEIYFEIIDNKSKEEEKLKRMFF